MQDKQLCKLTNLQKQHFTFGAPRLQKGLAWYAWDPEQCRSRGGGGGGGGGGGRGGGGGGGGGGARLTFPPLFQDHVKSWFTWLKLKRN